MLSWVSCRDCSLFVLLEAAALQHIDVCTRWGEGAYLRQRDDTPNARRRTPYKDAHTHTARARYT
eukprot:10541-Eustigmatos_ZCMA.PRE.1